NSLRERLLLLEQRATSTLVGGIKPKKPDSFGGIRKQRVDLWVFELDQYFAAVGMPNDRKVAYAASSLQGPAATWWRAHVLQAATPNSGVHLITTWQEFSDRIIAQFKPVNSETVARDRLFALKQLRSVISYVYEFNLLCLDIPNISESEKLDKFVRGLKSHVQRAVLIEDPLTVNEAMAVAQRIDSIYYRSNTMNYKDDGGDGNQRNKRRGNNGYAPMELDNVEMVDVNAPAIVNAIHVNNPVRNKQLSPEDKKRCRINKLCFNCKQPGHISRNCPKKINNKHQGKGKAQQ
ncbi:MAG: hypothetical protein ACTHJ5_16415, partial [Ilyomonas sp.]